MHAEIVALGVRLRQLGIALEDRVAFTAGWDARSAVVLTTGFRAFRVSSARLDPAVRQRVESDLGVPVLDAYGSSEAQNLAGEALDLPRRPGMVGPVLVPMRVMEGDAPAAPGEIGDLQVKGDKVFEGYFDDPAATAAAFTPDGWFRTGDRGRIEEGFLALAGREAETINSGGRKIDPLEVEAALDGFPGVRESAAFAIPDPLLGQRVGLAVVPDPGAILDHRAPRRHLLERLSLWNVPTSIQVLDALPRTANGKIRRAALSGGASRGWGDASIVVKSCILLPWRRMHGRDDPAEHAA